MTSMELLYSLGEIRTDYIRAAGQKPVEQKKTSFKYVWLIAALIAAALFLLGAAAYTRWSRSMEETYRPSQEIKEYAQSSGLSVMLEGTKPVDGSVLTATDQGITITAVQSIADEYGMTVVLRLEGFEPQDGTSPHVWYKTTIDGDIWFWECWRDDFNQEIASDGSLEFVIYYEFANHYRNAAYREVEICISALGSEICEGKAENRQEKQVTGDWKLHWKLSASEEKRDYSPNVPVGNGGTELIHVEIGPLSVRATYQLAQYFAGWETLELFQPAIAGVRLKDGTFVPLSPAEEGYEDSEKLVYYVEMRSMGTILEIDEVEALAFYGETEENVYTFAELNR